MIDRKKIAEKLRKIAEDCAISGSIAVNKTNAALYAAADELDPPEPKPLLADAKVGDLCKRRDGRYCQITDVIDGFPKLWKTANLEFHTSDGAYYKICTNADNTSPIIATEPLAPEGSAEWALQMMKLGKTISRTDNRKETYVYRDGKIVANEWHRADQQWFLKYAEPTGWQLYEPEPAFKAGDWVTDGAVQGRMVTRTSDTTWVEMQDGKQYHIETSHLRKLSPSEVIVNIGCLSGPVRRSSSSHFCIICGDHWSMIAFAMLLDTATRELVESLLKAQEEK